MNQLHIDVNLEEDAVSSELDWDALVDRAVNAAIEIANIELEPDAELSVLLCSDPTIQELNAKWRGKDKPTNVLSFPNEPDGFLLGDIIVSLATTQKEAELENKSLHDHFTHLIVHGFLHLFGYDHENDSDAETMEQLETNILASLDIADPYKSQ